MNIIDFDDISKEFKMAIKNVKLLNKSQSEIDKLENTVLHQIETSEKVSASEGYKYFKALQDIRNKRRIIKQQLTEQQCISRNLKPFIDSYKDTKTNIETSMNNGKLKYAKDFDDVINKLNKIKTL